jgi:hypothetical protein
VTCSRSHSRAVTKLRLRHIKVLALKPGGVLCASGVGKRFKSMTAESGHFSKNKNKGQCPVTGGKDERIQCLMREEQEQEVTVVTSGLRWLRRTLFLNGSKALGKGHFWGNGAGGQTRATLGPELLFAAEQIFLLPSQADFTSSAASEAACRAQPRARGGGQLSHLTRWDPTEACWGWGRGCCWHPASFSWTPSPRPLRQTPGPIPARSQ